jgi:hypothetical protein
VTNSHLTDAIRAMDERKDQKKKSPQLRLREEVDTVKSKTTGEQTGLTGRPLLF